MNAKTPIATLAAALFAGAAAFVPVTANAIAVYGASAQASLTIVGIETDPYAYFPPNIIIVGNFSSALTQGISSSFASGNATAAQSSGVSVNVGGVPQATDFNGNPLGDGGGPQGQTGAYMSVGDSIEQFADVSGSAAGQVDSLSIADAFSTGYIDMFDEYFAGEFLVHLRLDYSFQLQASVTDPNTETANAAVSIRLLDANSEDLIGPIEHALASGALADAAQVDVYVPSVFFAQTLTLLVDAHGAATAIPEPASLVLLASGCALLAARRRTQRV